MRHTHKPRPMLTCLAIALLVGVAGGAASPDRDGASAPKRKAALAERFIPAPSHSKIPAFLPTSGAGTTARIFPRPGASAWR